MPANLDEATWELGRELLAQKLVLSARPGETFPAMVFNPAYDGLRAVFQEPCPCGLSDPSHSYMSYEEHPISCKSCYLKGRHDLNRCQCDGTNLISRHEHWQAADPGALRGVLRHQVNLLWDSPFPKTPALANLVEALQGHIGYHETDQAALDALLKWL